MTIKLKSIVYYDAASIKLFHHQDGDHIDRILDPCFLCINKYPNFFFSCCFAYA